MVCKTGDGFITTAVLRDILHQLDDKLTDEDLDGIIEEVDEDGSGTVDFEGIKLDLNLKFNFLKILIQILQSLWRWWLVKEIRNYLKLWIEFMLTVCPKSIKNVMYFQKRCFIELC